MLKAVRQELSRQNGWHSQSYRGMEWHLVPGEALLSLWQTAWKNAYVLLLVIMSALPFKANYPVFE